MITAVTAWDVLVASPVAFFVGLIVGLAASSRWIIVRRNGNSRK